MEESGHEGGDWLVMSAEGDWLVMSAEGKGGTIKTSKTCICHTWTRRKNKPKIPTYVRKKINWKLVWKKVDDLVSITHQFEDSTLSPFGVTVTSTCHGLWCTYQREGVQCRDSVGNRTPMEVKVNKQICFIKLTICTHFPAVITQLHGL